ncbi:putative Polysaccharide biosynthesis protein [uncultured Desulfobacterium sp.]|uniref:Putative Polysaccharide biosynthesis protein n=1 Tax=uncultured Desulfobacterium sp. TaxID=201089 RepID=A0A445MZT5_9BACT|nr:putative Polysaccharide biosynthesis protein [uncultured Desulfobacterium sp.]
MSISVISESKLLAMHSLIYGLGNALNRVVALLLLPIYTRFLTPHDYGIKELVGLSTDVIGILLSTAISGAIYRFYFEYQDEKDRNEVISSAIITIGSFGLLTLTILSFATKTMARYILDSPELYYYFLISFASVWFNSLNDIGYNYLRANHQSLKYVVFSLVKLTSNIGMNIYFICFLKIGVLGILISTLITSILMFLVMNVPLSIKTGMRFSATKIKEMLRFGLPMIPGQFGAFLVNISDRFFIKGYCSVADAGLYSLGYRFGTLPANFISEPFNQVWQPRRFEIYKEDNSEKIFGKIFTYFLTFMLFAGLIIAMLTKDILMIISDSTFWQAYKIVPIIVLATIIFTFHYHLNMGILISKKTKYLAYINLSNGIFVLILNFLLIPKYGVFGATYATLFAFIYKIALTYHYSSKYYKIHFEFLRIGKTIIIAALIYCASLFIGHPVIYLSICLKVSLVLLYPVILLLLGFFTKEEKAKAADYFNRLLSIIKN